ncbi:CBS domain-containing protein [Desulfurispirillum indicum]|uniref:CBS domain-containing protein n=1 Tax=Desulfurispirillum indicum TaxID=936456 RepID=UPI001CFBF494|nr:CBS domain-containing protein [Desulfurispirillum indicum]UCZ56911.1 CBS domain-containing protein [Desulfurispirillum indicum]
MRLITSHQNPDFDAFASMVAAACLHPGATIVIIGSLSQNIQDYLELYPLPAGISLYKESEVNIADISHMVVVDASDGRRLGKLRKAFGKVPTIVYDHHQDGVDEEVADRDIEHHYCNCGANSSFMVRLLQKQHIALEGWLATLLLCGIYEDTGHLSYSSTRPLDCYCAGDLIAAGADLKQVHQILSRDWKDADIHILSDLLKNFETFSIMGVSVGISHADFHIYVPDVSEMLSNVMGVRRCTLLIVFLRMEGRIYCIVRSTSMVGANDVAALFEGGGHHEAASATVKEMTLVQAMDFTRASLKEIISRSKRTRTIMSSPAITIESHKSTQEAYEQFSRDGVNCLPVVEPDGSLYGILSKNQCMKALFHGLGGRSVTSITDTDIQHIEADEPFSRAEHILLSGRQAMVPVVEAKRVTGVITRTDLLREYRHDTDETLPAQERARSAHRPRHVRKMLVEVMGRQAFAYLEEASQLANEMDIQVYLVGGIVRDLVLRVKNQDMDFVVAGDGISFGNRLAERLGGRIRVHERFNTGVIILPGDDFRIDVASSRNEYYDHPGALPNVSPGSIKRDLYRRDFSINAMAVSLNTFELIDYFGGVQDIRDKKIRVLHNLSFIEDPTRIFRAVRFEQRYSFQIGEQTIKLLRSARDLDLIQHISGHRIYEELRHMFLEQEPAKHMARLFELDLMRSIHPALGYDQKTMKLVESMEDLLVVSDFLRLEDVRRDALYCALILRTIKAEQIMALPILQELPQRDREIIAFGCSKAGMLLHELGRTGKLWQKLRLVKRHEEEVLLLAIVYGNQQASAHFLREYLRSYRTIHPILRGDELMALGVPRGHQVGDALLMLTAYIIGRDANRPDRREEENFVRRIVLRAVEQ